MSPDRVEKILELLFDLTIEQAVEINLLRSALEFHRLANGPDENETAYRAEKRRAIEIVFAELRKDVLERGGSAPHGLLCELLDERMVKLRKRHLPDDPTE